jgi:hypothetical protein
MSTSFYPLRDATELVIEENARVTARRVALLGPARVAGESSASVTVGMSCSLHVSTVRVARDSPEMRASVSE